MTSLLNDHPIVGVLALVAGAWAMMIVTALVFFLFMNPEVVGASNIAVALVALFGLAFLNIRKLKGVE
jgi:uncharacterized membrane protein YfcA